MDFQTLGRKDLQVLCKKNKIPANMTNLAMADALKSLKSIEWEDEIKQKMVPQSDAIENHGSPLPRSRRVTAISSSDLSSFSIERQIDQELEKLKNKYDSANPIDTSKDSVDPVSKTPSTAVRRSQRVQSTATKNTATSVTVTGATAGTVTGTTRGRKKKEETVPVQTPATRRTVRTTAVKKAEANADVAVPKSGARTTRQSSRRPVESVGTARVTRNRAKMMSLDDETEIVETESKEVENTETEIAPLKEVEITETEIVPLKENEIAEIETIQLKEIETIETEITQLKETEMNESTESELPVVPEAELEAEPASDEKLEEKTELKEQEEETEQVSDEKMDSVIEEAELVSDISALSLESSIGEIKEEKELISETPVEVAELEESIEETIAEEQVEEINAEEQIEEIIAEEQIEEIIAEEQIEEIIAEEQAGVTIAEEKIEEIITEEKEDQIDQIDLNDSPIMGILTDQISVESTQQLTDSSNLTLSSFEENQTEICILSPVRPPTDPTVDKMMESVVRHLAKASIHESMSNVKGKKEEKDGGVSVTVSDLVGVKDENENQGKEKVMDLNCMSLRKLKAIYKEQVIGNKVVEVKRPALAELNDNLLA